MTAKLIGLLVVVIAFLALGLTAYHYKVSARDAVVARDAALRDLDTAKAVNSANQETIGRLKAQQERDADLAAKLADQLAETNSALNTANDERRKAEKDNEDARKFLGLRIPDSLRNVPKADGAH